MRFGVDSSLFMPKSGACVGAGPLGHCLVAFEAFKSGRKGPRVSIHGSGSVRVRLVDIGHVLRDYTESLSP